jgi:Uma2 family endonuclease
LLFGDEVQKGKVTMCHVVLRRSRAASAPLEFGPAHNGILLTAEEFDSARFTPGFRYELLHGVLIVKPAPSLSERDSNDELGHRLRAYRETHPRGPALDATAPEHELKIGSHRRRADRGIWCGLGRLPRPDEPPAIVIEFVSAGRRSRERDDEEKLIEYPTIGVREHWGFDRFTQRLTNYQFGPPLRKRVLTKSQTLRTPLLPGFVLPLAQLFALANRWGE